MSTFRQGVKYVWQLPNENEHMLGFASEYNVSPAIMQTILNRGFITREQIDQYLFSSLERDVASPALLKDADKVVERLLYAIKNEQKILVCGDYDVDGITASALVLYALIPLGAQINFFLPHRVHDGYGLSVKTVDRAADNGYRVIITVDNGITAYEAADRAKERGVDLIITDHHQVQERLPDAYAIVNPNQADCAYPFKKLAGVGVIFKVISLLYERLAKEMPAKVYELLLLGTIADVVPLIGENRFWVRHGLHQVRMHESMPLSILKRNGNVLKKKLSATDIAFSITPQLNALGRLDSPRQGVTFLIGSDPQESERVGAVLFELNQARKEIERSVLASLVEQVESKAIDVEKEACILAASSSWPPGVIGLVASRLVSLYNRPTFLLHTNKNGFATGSCRSVPGLDILQALKQSAHLLERFGGHTQAAGLKIRIDRIPAFKEALEQYIKTVVIALDVRPIVLDAQLPLSDATPKIVHDLELLEPFGHENPVPLFFVPQVTLMGKPHLLKDAHVKCQVFGQGHTKSVIFFNRPDLLERLIQYGQEPFDLAAQVTENEWNNKASLELVGTDIAGTV